MGLWVRLGLVVVVAAVLTAASWLGIEAARAGQVAAISLATIVATAVTTLGGVWAARASDRKDPAVGAPVTKGSQPLPQTAGATVTVEVARCPVSGVAGSSTSSSPAVVFEASPRYPKLDFSVVNTQHVPIQLTAMRVIKAASIKADYNSVRHLMGSRIELDFDLRSVPSGKSVSAHPGRVSNLRPGEAEAFELDLSATNTINLIDIELEYVSSVSAGATVARPPDIIFVSAPYEGLGWEGSVQVIDRSEAQLALLDNTPMPIDGPVAETHSHDARLLLMRGAAHLWFDDITEGWRRICEQLAHSPEFGPAAASFAELGHDRDLPLAVREGLEQWVTDPRAVQAAPVWDNESHALIVQEFLVEGVRLPRASHGSDINDGAAKLLSMLDASLDVLDVSDDDDYDADSFIGHMLGLTSLHRNREALLDRLIDCYGVGTIEYLLVNLLLSPLGVPMYTRLIATALGSEADLPEGDQITIEQEWLAWWAETEDRDLYSAFQWRPYSPRIAQAATALFADTPREVPADRNALVMQALITNGRVVDAFEMEFLRSPEARVRMMLAESDHASPEALARLAHDPAVPVRRWVAMNSHTDDATHRKLSQDQSEEVRTCLARTGRASPEIMAFLAQDASPVVRREVAMSPRTDDATLHKLSQDQSDTVRYSASMNPRTTKKQA